MARKEVKLTESAQTEKDEKNEKDGAKMINYTKKKQGRRHGARLARAIRRLLRGLRMSSRTGRTVLGASGALVDARWGRMPSEFRRKVEWRQYPRSTWITDSSRRQ